MSADILIVDDEKDIRDLLQGILEDEGYRIRQAANSAQAYDAIARRVPDLMIQDIWLQGSDDDGMQILARIRGQHPNLPVLMISGHGNIETAVQAIKEGAYDFIEKPFKSDRLLLMIDRALETARLRRENESLRARADIPTELIGDSPVLSTLRGTLARVAQANSRVLITGEPGTGKDIVARQIHALSARAAKPFMVVNCAILRPEHIENELFGTERPGESMSHGVLEQADGGTLLLDEVADMPLETQGKIVRALQEQRFLRVGGKTPVEVDVRILASTNRDLQALMSEGRFRQDLYYRLSVVPLAIPPLRERPQDIPALAEYFIRQYSKQSSLPPCGISPATMAEMQNYKWPGNVRQLRNAIEWMMIMWSGEQAIRPDQLPPELLADEGRGHDEARAAQSELMALPLREAREYFESSYLSNQIRRFGGNISKTAEFVGMERSALHRKLKQLGVSASGRVGDDDFSEPDADRRHA